MKTGAEKEKGERTDEMPDNCSRYSQGTHFPLTPALEKQSQSRNNTEVNYKSQILTTSVSSKLKCEKVT